MTGFPPPQNLNNEIGKDPIIKILRQEIIELNVQLNRRQRVEQALLATKRRLQRLISSSPSVIFSAQIESEFGIIFVSDSIAQFGYKPQDFLENLGLWKRCIHPDDLAHVLIELRKLEFKNSLVLEYRFRNSRGAYRWIQDQRRHVYDQDGLPIETVGSWQDITERKQMEDALHKEKETAQSVLQSIGDAVITTSSQGTVQYLNPTAEKLTGWSLNEAQNKPLTEVFQIEGADEPTPMSNII
ncbi:MAG: PAS domain S-box protein, partial [Cyanobacteria bacterium P01_F01_bin.42]